VVQSCPLRFKVRRGQTIRTVRAPAGEMVGIACQGRVAAR
jgi:hypothetical protein